MRVVEARGLRAPVSSAYVALYCEENAQRTRTLDGTKTDEPRWAEPFTFGVADDESPLHLMLCEQHLFGPHTFHGHAFVPLKELVRAAFGSRADSERAPARAEWVPT